MSVIDQKLIARNTMMLYLRMGLMLVISLYTSRVVLDALGENDFGIYNAVGGIVAMFSFISGTMSTACQRFYMVELGRGDMERLRDAFSLCVFAFCAFAAILIVAVEPGGLWFLRHKMLLSGRLDAAETVFHCSVLSFVLTVLRLPYQGMIIAREKMKVYAYVSIFEALFALGIALLLVRSGSDHLVLYAWLMLLSQVVVTALYCTWCLRFYPECRVRLKWDGGRFKEIFFFAGWNLIGSASSIFKVHGINLLLNMFFGPAVNAARGMAFKVYGSITQLQDNFMTASKPQIIKAYSVGEHEGMRKLVYQSAKFSSFLMLLVTVPVVLEMPYLLGIWLKDVPQYTAVFASIMLANALIDYIDYPLWVAIQATGRVKAYQLTLGTTQLMVLPVAYFMLKLGSFPPSAVFWVALTISLLCVVARVLFARHLAGLRPIDFVTRTLLPVAGVAAVSFAAAMLVRRLMPEGLPRLIIVIVTSVAAQCAAMLAFGLTRSERCTILEKLHFTKAGKARDNLHMK